MLVKEYSDFSMETPGCSPGAAVYRAQFKLDADVTHLFPYINAEAEDAVYYDTPHYVQFSLEGYRCALYPEKAVAALFQNREQALDFIGRLTDFLNDLDSRKDSIDPDHRTYRPVPVLDIYQLLPRSNCRECGFSSCMAFAAALSKGETASLECPELCDPENENVAKLQSMIEDG